MIIYDYDRHHMYIYGSVWVWAHAGVLKQGGLPGDPGGPAGSRGQIAPATWGAQLVARLPLASSRANHPRSPGVSTPSSLPLTPTKNTPRRRGTQGTWGGWGELLPGGPVAQCTLGLAPSPNPEPSTPILPGQACPLSGNLVTNVGCSARPWIKP